MAKTLKGRETQTILFFEFEPHSPIIAPDRANRVNHKLHNFTLPLSSRSRRRSISIAGFTYTSTPFLYGAKRVLLVWEDPFLKNTVDGRVLARHRLPKRGLVFGKKELRPKAFLVRASPMGLEIDVVGFRN